MDSAVCVMQKPESSKTSIPSHLNNPLSPKQVCVMQKPMLDPIVACLLHGISQAAESEIARKSVEALDALASHTLTSPPQPPAPSLLDVYPLLQVCSRSRFVSLSLAQHMVYLERNAVKLTSLVRSSSRSSCSKKVTFEKINRKRNRISLEGLLSGETTLISLLRSQDALKTPCLRQFSS